MTSTQNKIRSTAKRQVVRLVKQSQVESTLNRMLGAPWVAVVEALTKQFPDTSLPGILKAQPVALRTVLKDGKVRVPRQGDTPLSLEDASELYYVDPTNKTLCKNEARLKHLAALHKARQKAEKESSAMRKELTSTLVALCKGDTWHVVELAPLTGAAFDAYLRRTVGPSDTRELYKQYGKSNVFAVATRELTYRERHQLGLESLVS